MYTEEFKNFNRDKLASHNLETLDKNMKKVEKYKDQFPYHVIYKGSHDHLDEVIDWCWNTFGPRNGVCDWHLCELGYDYWFNKNNLYDKLDEFRGPKPSREDKVNWDIFEEKTHQWFKNLPKRNDYPHEHSHDGTWKTVYLLKTGYDYGYEKFMFQNEEDAFYLRLIWDESFAERDRRVANYVRKNKV